MGTELEELEPARIGKESVLESVIFRIESAP